MKGKISSLHTLSLFSTLNKRERIDTEWQQGGMAGWGLLCLLSMENMFTPLKCKEWELSSSSAGIFEIISTVKEPGLVEGAPAHSREVGAG